MAKQAASRSGAAPVLWGIAVALGLGGAARGHADTPQQIAFVQAPVSDSNPAGQDIPNSLFADRYRRGQRVVVASLDQEAGKLSGDPRVISTDFDCATDPAFSYDGRRLVFAGRRSSDGYLQVWALDSMAGQARQVVRCKGDCVMPVVGGAGEIVFASLLSGEYEEHGALRSFSLYVLERGADAPTRLTFNPSSDFDPTFLPDGRVLYASWQHVGNHRWPRGTVALTLINSDGTGVFPLTGNHRDPWLKRGPQAFGRDRVAFIQAERVGRLGAGALVATSLNDAFAPYQALVDSEKFEVSGAAAMPNGDLLLSARPLDGSGATFGLYLYHAGTVRPVYDDPKFHELAPAWGGGVPRPELRFSVVDAAVPYGYVAILNCAESDRKDQHPLSLDAVGAVRVLEGLPLHEGEGGGPKFVSVTGRDEEPLAHPASATGNIPVRILGEVPPAADGSVYLKVPADRPLRIQLVDRDGFSIVNERAWFWVRPKERRVCIGCHENRELSPRNAAPLAVGRSPTDLTKASEWETVSFRQDIAPILKANCALSGCHVPPTPTAGMNLARYRLNGNDEPPLATLYGPAYANLLARQDKKPFSVGGRRVHPGDARSSPLLWMLYGRALAPQYRPAPFERPMMSAHPGPMLPEAQLELIRKWVDLGAMYNEKAAAGPWPYEIPSGGAVALEGKVDGK